MKSEIIKIRLQNAAHISAGNCTLRAAKSKEKVSKKQDPKPECRPGDVNRNGNGKANRP